MNADKNGSNRTQNTPSTQNRRESIPLHTIPPATSGIDLARLVGTPHLFSRVRNLREGQLFEPIGMLTMRPEGKISGHGHPNEGTWIPYIHGEVSGEHAFAFVTAHNNWIPSSTWTQSMGDMPTGFFCDEPEIVQAAHQLCLIPQTPLASETVLHYVIATCLSFYERTLPVLLAQLFAEGIERSRIKVVVNGCSENSNSVLDGIDYAFSTHNAWEWSALYEAPLRWKFDYAFLMHDTNVVFPGSGEVSRPSTDM